MERMKELTFCYTKLFYDVINVQFFSFSESSFKDFESIEFLVNWVQVNNSGVTVTCLQPQTLRAPGTPPPTCPHDSNTLVLSEARTEAEDC